MEYTRYTRVFHSRLWCYYNYYLASTTSPYIPWWVTDLGELTVASRQQFRPQPPSTIMIISTLWTDLNSATTYNQLNICCVLAFCRAKCGYLYIYV